ncbi:hypothetical protein NADFUDRAFT_51471 [Nadsonia fulvescens var. elongata DSM 6958]|uniref:Uncharacterized protein n=1 Tax=Nadsonia fulvescens var. elongata DSM 6958 TaxID=857566 RepID=A0A1E3PHT9_9ASCO|nr:hypothetical protein NADFUDRAFT_51471 [Nadsonia fulvescens var. elongata DSM 6958]
MTQITPPMALPANSLNDNADDNDDYADIDVISEDQFPEYYCKSNAQPLTWRQIRTIIAHNHIQYFGRTPAERAKYEAHKLKVNSLYPRPDDPPSLAIINPLARFLIDHQLHWPLTCLNAPTAPAPNVANVLKSAKILDNAFQYRFVDGITHLCVWSQLRLETTMSTQPGQDVATADLTPQAKHDLDVWIKGFFPRFLNIDSRDICCFKNWAGLQSVGIIEHFHVLLRGVPRDRIDDLLQNQEKYFIEFGTK